MTFRTNWRNVRPPRFQMVDTCSVVLRLDSPMGVGMWDEALILAQTAAVAYKWSMRVVGRAESYAASSSILIRKDFRNLRSWSLTFSSGLLESVVTIEVLSDFSPGRLTPI